MHSLSLCCCFLFPFPSCYSSVSFVSSFANLPFPCFSSFLAAVLHLFFNDIRIMFDYFFKRVFNITTVIVFIFCPASLSLSCTTLLPVLNYPPLRVSCLPPLLILTSRPLLSLVPNSPPSLSVFRADGCVGGSGSSNHPPSAHWSFIHDVGTARLTITSLDSFSSVLRQYP